MIPPEQVQDSVHEEHGELGEQIVTCGCSLPTRRLDAHDHIPELVADIAKLPFAHSEREDICRAILVAVVAVQLVDLRVVRQHDRKLGIPEGEGVEHHAHAARDLRARQPSVRPSFDSQLHRHARNVLNRRIACER